MNRRVQEYGNRGIQRMGDYSDSRGVHGTRPPDGSQPQRDRPVESVAMHRVPDRRLFSDDGNCPSREVRRGGGHAGRATPPEARIKSLSDDDGLTTQLTNAIAAKVLNALTTSGLGVAAPVESLPRTRPAPASQFGRTQAGTRVWASDSRSKGVVELLDNSAGSTKSIPSAGGWSSRPVSTQRTGWSAESPPRTGWSAGATPRTGWSARTTPRTGWSAGATPRTGWSAGATPRTGWSAGATPRTGWSAGATPRTGWSAGATPRTGWSASATPRTGWSAGAANQSQGSGTSVLPTRLQHYGAAESRQVQSVKRLLGQTKNPLAVNDRSLPKKPGLTTPTKSVSFNSQKVSPKEKVPASEKPATTCESTPNGKQNKSVTPKKKGQVNGFSNEVDKSEIGEESRQESKQPEDQINVRMAAGASVAVGGKRGPSTDISLVEPKKKWFKSGVIDGKEKKREMDKQDQFKKDLEFLPAGYPLECRLCGYTTNQVEDFTAHLDTKFHQMSIEETLRADRIRLQRLVQASQTANTGKILRNRGKNRTSGHCKICETHYFDNNLSHIRTKHHKQIAKHVFPRCTECQISQRFSRKTFLNHRSSTAHVVRVVVRRITRGSYPSSFIPLKELRKKDLQKCFSDLTVPETYTGNQIGGALLVPVLRKYCSVCHEHLLPGEVDAHLKSEKHYYKVVEKKNQLLDAEKKQKADTTVQARKNGFYGKMVKEDGHAETEAKGNVHSEDQAKGENQEQ